VADSLTWVNPSRATIKKRKPQNRFGLSRIQTKPFRTSLLI